MTEPTSADHILLVKIGILLAFYVILTFNPFFSVMSGIRLARFMRPSDTLHWLYCHVNRLGGGLINAYGMFGALHDTRYELMVEGSSDGRHWARYGFHYKGQCFPAAQNLTSDICSHVCSVWAEAWNGLIRPPLIRWGYWPRLDWHMWFLPLSYTPGQMFHTVPDWYDAFEQALLEGKGEVGSSIER